MPNEFTTARLRQHRAEQATHRAPPARPDPGSLLDIGKGSVAATLGFVGDIFANYSSPGANAEIQNYPEVVAEVRRSDRAHSSLPPEDQPFTTEWFGKRFGADVDSTAFSIGEWIDPRGAAKKTVPIMFAGALAGKEALDSIGHFVRKGKRTIQENFNLAQQKIKTESPQKVWMETGWILDPVDAQWKYQINSWDTKINENKLWELDLDPEANKNLLLGDLLDAPEIYNTYPSLRDIKVELFPRTDANLGYAQLSPFDPKIGIALDPLNNSIDNIRNTLVHEIEHFIQNIEGHGIGASPLSVDDPGTIKYLNGLPKTLADKDFELDVLRYVAANSKRDEFGFPMEPKDLIEGYLKNWEQKTGKSISDMKPEHAEIVMSFNEYNNPTIIRDKLSRGAIEREFIQKQYDLVRSVLERDNDMELGAALDRKFFEAYQATLGEVNARLTSYDNRLGSTRDGRRILETVDPITRRNRMLQEEGISPSSVTLQDPNRIPADEARRYRTNIRTREQLGPLLEAISNHLNPPETK